MILSPALSRIIDSAENRWLRFDNLGKSWEDKIRLTALPKSLMKSDRWVVASTDSI